MWSFDLNSLQTKPMWELIEAKGSVPARRSGHVCVAYGDEIVIFGGTDGHFHYNDTWSFDMTTRQWTEMSCIGFIPAVREGHAAAIVKDVMYIFGGRDVRGKPLQDLAALRISGAHDASHILRRADSFVDQRWFMFSEMGPAPSGRSGHAMTSFNGKVYVLGGEAEDSTLGDDPAFMHVLDTSIALYFSHFQNINTMVGHIKYPPPPSPDQEMSLRRQDLDSKFRNSLVVATQRLATKSGLYPARYELKDVSQIGDYPVAAGGFSDIYKGDFQGQVVCIKTMRLYQKKQIDHAMKKLSKEAILWGQLSHPNILSIFGIFKFRGLVSIISQWMEHGDVNEYLNNNPSASRLNLALDVVNGLSYIHEHGIIHGDLKGSNVLVDDTGHARLADFGISSISDPDIVAWTLQSASQSEGGTIRWQAPELFAVETTAGGAKNSIESDMYSWGCVCFEIFTGEIPFLDINNNFAVMVAVKAGSRPMRPCMSSSPWTNWGLTDGVWLCMEECWKETPSDRPTASAVAQRFTPGPEDIRQEAGQGMFSPAEFRSRMSQPFDMVAVEFLNNLLHKSQP
ncbi:hypothetical protein DXG01_009456 [Tephrocybe rancida]|nr:hypothetical protein DXG01_009456 [Tephrocybe rancida]